MARGKYEAEVNVRLKITVYAEDKDEARMVAFRVVHMLIKRTGAGDGTVTGLAIRRKGSAKDERSPRKEMEVK